MDEALDLDLAPRWVSPHLRLPPIPRSLLPGLMLLVGIVLLALCAGYLAPYNITKMSPTESLQAPSLQHFLGTDVFGRDLFSRVLLGARLSLAAALMAMLVGALPGTVLGMVAGMFPGLPSSALTYLMDAWMAVPGLLLALAMAASLGRSTSVLALALGIAGIPTYYRQARAETLCIRQELYVSAARAIGATELHILVRHVFPNILPKLLVLVTLRLGGLLMGISALSFIGLGAQPPEPEWGALLAEGRDYLQQAWWLTFFPGVAIGITVLGFNLLGDGLRDTLDRKSTTII